MSRKLIALILMLGGLPALAIDLNELAPDYVETWVESHISGPVAEREATAAAVAVVQGGNVIVAKNFGWFDPVELIPVDERSQFKIASITKNFTGLSVVKLIDSGLIESIDDPANKYLKRHPLPGAWGGQVTIAHLMTHASGLDSPALGLTADDQKEIPASAEFLAARIPSIIREPGTRMAYANFGMAVIQSLIEDVTGERYDHFLDRAILRPLGMNDSVLGMDRTGGPTLVRAGKVDPGNPDSAATLMRLSTNAPFVATSGSMQVTAADMARYMNAQLGHMPDVVTREMIDTQQQEIRGNYPGLGAAGLGVFAARWNDHTIWSHGGLVAGFRSRMVLVPELDLGLFVVFAGGDDIFFASGGDSGAALDQFLREILGDYILPPEMNEPANPEAFVGRYWTEVRAHGSPDIMLSLQGVSTVTADGQGIAVNGRRFVEIAPGLFREKDDTNGLPPRMLALNGDEILGNVDFQRRVSGLGDPANWSKLSFTGLILSLSGFIGAFYGKERGVPMVIAAASAGLYALVLLKFMFGPSALFEIFNGDIRWRYAVAKFCGWILVLSGVYLLLKVVSAWRSANGALARLATLHVLSVGLGALVLAWMMFLMNLF